MEGRPKEKPKDLRYACERIVSELHVIVGSLPTLKLRHAY